RLGVALLRDAMLRTLAVADQVGVRCLLVHALSDKARRFYARRGFQEARVDPMTLMLPLAKIRQRLGAG
ncbi:MAG: GNAT family N-acetyltransferase, partial [Gammaproteobacteria bacterium]